MEDSDKIRNISIISRVDHGKSTLTAQLIQSSISNNEEFNGENQSLVFENPSMMNDFYQVNLVDSPSFVEFFNTDIMFDGAILVVDAVEGHNPTQSARVYRKLVEEKVKPILFINKVDRLIEELQLDEEESYRIFERIIENANVSLYNGVETVSKLNPVDCNVVFGSAKMGWSFSLDQFAQFYSSKFNFPKDKLMKRLWGDYYFDRSTKKFTSQPYSSTNGQLLKRTFCEFILQPIYTLFRYAKIQATSSDGNMSVNFEKILDGLLISLTKEEKKQNSKQLIETIMKKFLPIRKSMISVIVNHLPSPKVGKEESSCNKVEKCTSIVVDHGVASFPVEYSMETILGNQLNGTSTWPFEHVFAFVKVFSSQQQPERIMYATVNSNHDYNLYKIDKLEGVVEVVIKNVFYFVLVGHQVEGSSKELIHDIIYYHSPTTCNLYKYNVTDSSTQTIVGGICKISYVFANTKKFTYDSELSIYVFDGNQVFQVSKDMLKIVVGGGTSLDLHDQPATNVSNAFSYASMNSIGEMYLIQNSADQSIDYYYIRKVYANGIITTVTKFSGNIVHNAALNFNTFVYEKENKKFVTDFLYLHEYPSGIMSKIELTFEYPNNETPKLINITKSNVFGKYMSNTYMGDGGLASDARTSTANIDILDDRYISVSFSNIRVIDTKTGLISSVLFPTGHAFFTTGNNLKFTPKDIIYSNDDGNQELIISDITSASLFKYSLKSKSIKLLKKEIIRNLNNAPSTANPYSIALDSNSNLIISNDMSYWNSNFLVNLTNDLAPKVIFGQNEPSDSSSCLSRPYGAIHVVFNFTNYIFVTDKGNNRVLQVERATGMIKTIASQNDGISGPTGICSLNNFIIFSDTINNVLRSYNMVTGKLDLFAGKLGVGGFNDGNLLNATFNQPVGLVSGFNGNIYVADSQNHAIRKISLMDVTTIAGTGVGGFNGDLLDPINTQFNSPMGLFTDGSDFYIHVADTNNHRIRLVDTFHKIVTTIAGSSMDGNSGDEGLAIRSLLSYPHNVVTVSNSIYVADSGNHKIREIKDNIIRTVVGKTGIPGFDGDGLLGVNAKLNFPTCLNVDSKGILISDTKNNRIRYYSASEKNITTILGGFGDNGPSKNSIGSPLGISLSKNNEIYVTDIMNNLIRRIKDGIIQTVAGSGSYGYNGDNISALKASLASPSNLVVNPLSGDIIFSDTNNHRIRIVYSNGNISTLAGTGDSGFNGDGIASTTQLDSPTFIKLIPPKYEEIIFSDSYNRRIRKLKKVNDQYWIYTIAGSDWVGIPEGLAISDENEIYFADSKKSRVSKLVPFCKSGYVLSSEKTECIPTCSGISAIDSSSCSGHGSCIDTNKCQCYEKYLGEYCQFASCFHIASTNRSVCSARGTCNKPDTCECFIGFTGVKCEKPICFGKTGIDECNKRGHCVDYNVCKCDEGYYGNACETNMILIGSLIGVFVPLLAIIGITLLILCFIFFKYRKQKKIIDTDLTLDERLLSQTELEISNTSSSRSTYDEEDKFIIPIEQLNMDKPIKRLGEGGIGSVFMTRYNGMTIAVKVFDLNNFNISENDFKIEAILLSKIRHPFIISFYGISSTPTKRFIAMECMDKSLENVIGSLQKGLIKYSLKQKLAILQNVVSGINYLHHMEPNFIVHRDLKPANILLDKNGIAKLCDFGLGRALSNNTVSALTNQIGTSNYMSPELFSGDIGRGDARSIDIYSLAIIMWQLVFEIMEPYQSVDPKVLEKLNLKTPKTFNSTYHFHKSVCEEGLRPIIPFSTPEECKEWCANYLPDQLNEYHTIYELSELMKQSWSHDPIKRPATIQILSNIEKWDETQTN